MRITPLEVQTHQFARRLSGVDPEEVGTFLQMVADDYEQVVRDHDRLKDQVMQLERRNEELASGEKMLRATLVSAQDMAEKLRETAVAESEALMRTAESRAEKILDAAHRRVARLGEEIRELKGLRTHFAEALRASIDTHLTLIDRLEDEPDEPIKRVTAMLSQSAAKAAAIDVPRESPPQKKGPGTNSPAEAKSHSRTAPSAVSLPLPSP